MYLVRDPLEQRLPQLVQDHLVFCVSLTYSCTVFPFIFLSPSPFCLSRMLSWEVASGMLADLNNCAPIQYSTVCSSLFSVCVTVCGRIEEEEEAAQPKKKVASAPPVQENRQRELSCWLGLFFDIARGSTL